MKKNILLVLLVIVIMSTSVFAIVMPDKVKKPLQEIWAALMDLQEQITNSQGQINDLEARVAALEAPPLECTSGQTRQCGTTDVGECVYGIETCVDSQWGGICAGEVNPTTEVCDGVDNNCDGAVDEGEVCEINIDECAPEPCQNGGICTDGINSYTCSCTAGWEGPECSTPS